MLTLRLRNCVDCNTIPALLDKIDCKLTELAHKEYLNIVYAINRPIKSDTYLDLLNYKRILTYKYCNEEYAAHYSVTQIASKVNLLIFK